MARILVTGAAGFLGSHLCDALLARGWDVVGLDNFSQGQESNLETCLGSPRFSLRRGDVLDRAAVRSAAVGADVIAHLAAFKIPRYGSRLQTLEINTFGTHNVLEAARQHGARVLLASTSDCYGKNSQVPFAETDDSVLGAPTVARWAYAVSKSMGEHLCLAYHEEHGVPVTIARYFGSYGPRHHLSWWGGPQPVFIDQALLGKPLEVHGDGTQSRCFTYVSDTIAATIVLLEANPAVTAGQLFNIGSDQEITIGDLARLVWRLIRPDQQPLLEFVPYQSFTGRAYEDVQRRIPDLTKIRQLGWHPQVSLEAGLRQAISWQRAVRAAVRAA